MNQQSPWTPPPQPKPPFTRSQQVWQQQSSLLQPNDSKSAIRDLQRVEELRTGEIVAGLNPAKIQEVAASQVVVVEHYYKMVLNQAQRLFRWALTITGTGLAFLLAGVIALILQQPISVSVSIACTVCGVVLEGIAGFIFILYGRALSQLEGFHKHLDRTQQYLLANAICENLEGDNKQLTQTELFRVIMDTLISVKGLEKKMP